MDCIVVHRRYGLAGSEEVLRQLVERLVKTSDDYGMEINVGKTKTMTNHPEGIINPIQVKNEKVEEVQKFIYLGATISEDGSKPEIIRRIAQATAILTKLKIIWKKEYYLKIKNSANALFSTVHIYLCMRKLDVNIRYTEKNPIDGNEVFQETTEHKLHRSHYQ